MPRNENKKNLYFIALIAPAKIRKESEGFKKEIKQKFGAKNALKLPAHITLQIPFRMEEKKETSLIRALQKFSESQRSFEIKFYGFGKFSRNVIFIKVADHEPVTALFKKLQEVISGCLELKENEKTSRFHPHLTIASRDLSRRDFPEAWASFKDRQYEASFTADRICLMKHNGKTWDIYRSFEFRS